MEIKKIKIDEQFIKKTKFGKYEKQLNEVFGFLKELKDDEAIEIKNVDSKTINAIRCNIKSTSDFSKKSNKKFISRYKDNNLYIRIKPE